MRYCRYWRCKRPFLPQKAHYFYCCWQHRVDDVGADYERDYHGYGRSRETHYDRGYWDGARLRPPTDTMPPHIWKALVALVHPDRWQQEPGLLALSHEAMVWLNTHRPIDPERN